MALRVTRSVLSHPAVVPRDGGLRRPLPLTSAIARREPRRGRGRNPPSAKRRAAAGVGAAADPVRPRRAARTARQGCETRRSALPRAREQEERDRSFREARALPRREHPRALPLAPFPVLPPPPPPDERRRAAAVHRPRVASPQVARGFVFQRSARSRCRNEWRCPSSTAIAP